MGANLVLVLAVHEFGVLVASVIVPSAMAQLPKRVEKCLPYPTLAQEIQEMRTPEPVHAPVAPVNGHVRRVEFEPKDDIPANVREEISQELRNMVFGSDANPDHWKDWSNEIAEVNVRGSQQNRGYLKALATLSLKPYRSDGSDIDVVASVSATPGLQYRLGNLRIESADPDDLSILPEVLRALFPLQRGELFSVEKAQPGLENMGRAFVREGYIDMTAEPVFDVDEAHEGLIWCLRSISRGKIASAALNF